MEDTSSASSDSDNALLSPNGKSRIGCNAATQTPEMPRHEIKGQHDSSKKNKSSDTKNSDSSIVVYKLDTQKPLSKLEKDAKSLAIPDVVVEYIKDSYNRQDRDEIELGTTNPAFEPQELIVVRTSSSVSLRDDVKQETAPGFAKANRRLYYSLPRTSKKSADAIADNVHSQSSTPKMDTKHLGVGDQSLYVSSSSLGYPRSIPPSPNFGYRPLESESSAVYTIIAPVKYVANGKDEKENELKLIEELRAQLDREKKLKRNFEFSPAPIEIERKRQRLQCCTDLCSTLFLIPGILIAIITPISLIPMFILPLTYYIPLIAIFIISGIISVLSLAMSGLTGNIVWHYDPDKQRLRPRLHCGKGPLFHFWGNGFYASRDEKKPLNGEKIV